MIKAILFDLDGTIADTIDAIRHGINLAMCELGYPESSREDVLSHINFGARHLIRLSLPEQYQSDEARVDEALAVYNRTYSKTYMETDRPYDGIPEVVLTLAARGYAIGVLSNKQDAFVQNLVPALLPEGTYKAVRGQVPGAPAKPDPTVPLSLCRALGAEPHECVLVGDSDVDMATAKNAGFLAVGVSWGYRSRERLLEKGADAIAETPEDIVKIVDKL